MKRAFANIGFTFAVTLIILNFLDVRSALAAFTAVSVLFVIFIACRKTRKAAVFPLSMLSAALASLIFIVNYYGVFLPQSVLSGENVSASVYIVDVEQKTQSGYSYTVKTNSIELPAAPQNIKLTVYSDERIDAQSYELLNVNMSLFSAGDNAYDSRGSFDDNIYLRGYVHSYQNSGESVRGLQSVNRYFIEMREKLSSIFRDKIGADEGALALAVLTGDTADLSGEAYNNFKACGATHLMAVSGFNLAVLTGMLYKLLRRLLVPKVPLVTVCCASVLFYVMLAGFSVSMVRAAIMMTVFLLSKLFNEKADSMNSLGFAAFIVCLDPYAVTDAGALLTFTAVLGLIAVYPLISPKKRTQNRFFRLVSDTILASVSVFITTFPVMYFMFGQVSIIGLLLNVVLIPLSEVLLVAAAVFCVFSSYTPLSFVTAGIIKAVSGAMVGITDFFAQFSFSTVNIDSRFFALLIFCVFTVFAAGFFIKAGGSKLLFKQCVAISCAFTVLISALSVYYKSSNSFLRVIHGEHSNAVVVYDKDYALVFGMREYEQYYTAKEIIKANDLNLAMIIDYDGEYAELLAREFGCRNFVSNSETVSDDTDIRTVNTDGFSLELWDGLEMTYRAENSAKTVGLKICSTYFEFSDADLANAEKYDIIYTVNENGYVSEGVNKWAG